MKKKRLFTLLSVLVVLGGLAAAVGAITQMQNYFRPYTFSGICGTFGLIVGFLAARKLMSIARKKLPHHLQDKSIQYNVAIGFIGFGLLLGTSVNHGISRGDSASYIINTKESSPAAYRKAPKYFISIELNGKQEIIQCKYEYWNSLTVGDPVQVAYHHSPIGFDFLELPSEK